MLVVALVLLGGLAAVSVLLSDAPRAVAWPAALVAIGWGASLARREARRPRIEVVITPHAERSTMPVARLDGRACPVLRLRWRGTLAFLDLEDGTRVRRLVFGPDGLKPGQRRELRLIVPRAVSASARPSMAP